MRQLVELGKRADEFKALNCEIICIFREEGEGAKGLVKVKEKTKSPFTLAVDKDKTSTMPYSSKKMTFDNFVIDKSGNIKAVIPGTLRDRATAIELIKHLKELEQQ